MHVGAEGVWMPRCPLRSGGGLLQRGLLPPTLFRTGPDPTLTITELMPASCNKLPKASPHRERNTGLTMMELMPVSCEKTASRQDMRVMGRLWRSHRFFQLCREAENVQT